MCTVRVWNLVVICFNRYMVECESISFPSGFGTGYSFNRYMVECELSDFTANKNAIHVLIDTWWNVNDY